MSTSDRVVDILVKEGGYRSLPMPFKIGSQQVEFTHALLAEHRANDLVLIIDVKGDTADDVITRKVLASTRALDVLRSRRPVTVILTAGQPHSETVRSISKVCRVLPVGSPTGPNADRAVRDWVAVLLPLAQPNTVESKVEWEAELDKLVAARTKSPLMQLLIAAAPGGKDAVEAALANCIDASVTSVLNDEANST
jgi:hypothetical protein